MSSKVSVTTEGKKAIKRRLGTNPKLSAEELTRRILLFFIENLVGIDKIDNNYFKSCIINNEMGYSPDSETLFHMTNEIFHDYQLYFQNYFSNLHPNFQISLTIHKWLPPDEINPLVFINCHYVNHNFKLCQLPLGLFEYNDSNFSNFLINNEKLLKKNLHLVTSNFQLSETQQDLLSYSMDRLKDDTINKYMFYCLPKVLEEMLGKCIMQLSQALTLDHAINSINIDNIHSSKDYISYLIQNFLGPLYRKLTKLNFDALLPLSEDMNNIYFDILNNHSMKSKKNFSQTYLSGIIFYKNMINSKEISNQDWELIQFIYDFTCTFHEIICCCEANENPNIHMLSKWLKILIIHISTFSKSRAMLLNIKIDSYLLELLNEIKQLHDSIQENFNLIVASYLHPSTKRYLNDQQVGRINSYVGKLSSKNSNQKESTAASLSIDNMEDMIMQLFDCSGKATKECYNYETSSTSEIKYNKNATYISRENGPHLLHFWERNQYKYSTLSDLASQSLGIQLSTNLKSIESFKNAYGGLKNEDCYPIHFLQQFYVLHGLSKCYDLQSFDPKQSDGDIDNFRIEPPDYIDMDLDSSFEIDFKQYQAKRSKK